MRMGNWQIQLYSVMADFRRDPSAFPRLEWNESIASHRFQRARQI